MSRFCIYLFVVTFFLGCNQPHETTEFVKVSNTQFILDGKSHKFVGTNFWYGAYLGQSGEKGDRNRLVEELDFLKKHGITNLRVLGSSEEAVFKNSLSPTFINADGTYNEDLLVGLDFLLTEMKKREMHAVIFLTNFWEWSGGMSTINSWYDEDPIIDPSTGDWNGFMNYSARFYQNEEAQNAFREYIAELINRTNTINGESYVNDPTIMSWQLANEPRPGRGDLSAEDIQAYVNWITETARYIKSLDSNHLVSSGSEGMMGSLQSMDIFIEAHDSEYIDYLTFHMWAKNWSWIDPSDMEATISAASENATAYIISHVEVANEMNKPIVMEEFGFPRDHEVYAKDSPTKFRDQYYKMVFDLVENYEVLAGTNFWSWGGFGEAQNEDYWWMEGDPFTGDPPQEPQGLNSVFASDSSTLTIINTHAQNIGLDK